MISDDKAEILIKALLAEIDTQELKQAIKKHQEMPLWAPDTEADDTLEIDNYDPLELEHYENIFD